MCLGHRAYGSLWLGVLLAGLTGVAAPPSVVQGGDPIALHPQNPRYFVYEGRPRVLITSAEHYGAVLNLDFDFTRYLRTLQADRLSLTRVFSGAYVEPQGAFRIERNTLAPAPGRLICPWARSAVPGGPLGGNKFDLDRWDDAYFRRLREFVDMARQCGVIVEYTLFCPFYEDSQWKLSPQHPANHLQPVGPQDRQHVYTLDRHAGLLAVHEALVRKVVSELNDCDNVLWELCNEPYFGGVTLEWQHRIADVIVETEQRLPRRHLITQNVANGKARVDQPHPAVSVFNFHYATPPDAVPLNRHLNRVIGDNETGFKGTGDAPYRREAWEFILAGGALFNHLDYSFVAGQEDGTFAYPATQPGGGNAGFRRQLRVLHDFIHSFDLPALQPLDVAVRKGGGRAYGLGTTGRQYALYYQTASAPAVLALDLPAGRYRLDWVNPLTGAVELPIDVEHAGGPYELVVPPTLSEVAVRIQVP